MRTREDGYTDVRESEHGRGRVSSRKPCSSGGLITAARGGQSCHLLKERLGNPWDRSRNLSRGAEAGVQHPQTRHFAGGKGGTGPPRLQRVHHRTFSPRPPPSCRSASSFPQSSCICPRLESRWRARSAQEPPYPTVLLAGGRPAFSPRLSLSFGPLPLTNMAARGTRVCVGWACISHPTG